MPLQAHLPLARRRFLCAKSAFLAHTRGQPVTSLSFSFLPQETPQGPSPTSLSRRFLSRDARRRTHSKRKPLSSSCLRRSAKNSWPKNPLHETSPKTDGNTPPVWHETPRTLWTMDLPRTVHRVHAFDAGKKKESSEPPPEGRIVAFCRKPNAIVFGRGAHQKSMLEKRRTPLIETHFAFLSPFRPPLHAPPRKKNSLLLLVLGHSRSTRSSRGDFFWEEELARSTCERRFVFAGRSRGSRREREKRREEEDGGEAEAEEQEERRTSERKTARSTPPTTHRHHLRRRSKWQQTV